MIQKIGIDEDVIWRLESGVVLEEERRGHLGAPRASVADCKEQGRDHEQ